MKTKFLTFCVALACATSAFAYDFVVDGIYYTKKGGDSIAVAASPNYNYLGSVVIPSSVTYDGSNYRVVEVNGNAFNSCVDLTSVSIPNSVRTIGMGAFLRCTSLISVIIPNSINYIGSQAFGNCGALKEVFYQGNVASWCRIRFQDYTSNPITTTHHLYIDGQELTSAVIPDDITYIYDYAFAGCSNLTNITIPSSVTEIGREAFYGCGISSIIIPSSVTKLGAYTFLDCPNLEKVTINSNSIVSKAYNGMDKSLASYYLSAKFKELVLGNEVTSIGNYALGYCDSLMTITIPSSVTSIGNSAFRGCSNLFSIAIPESVTSIGNYAFSDCSSLSSVVIPESVTTIDNGTFSNCSNLSSITIPNSVTSIGRSAFYDCTSLSSITIPNSVTSIGNNLFSNCSSLSSIAVPNSVTAIGDSTFFNCSSLSSIVIPEGVTSIGNYVFSGCSSLSSIVIPEGVTSIGNYVFSGSSNLSSITIPESVTSIGSSAFSNCENLTSITIPFIGTSASSTTGHLSDVFGGTVPNSLRDVVVTSAYQIPSQGFNGCKNLTTIVLPNSLDTIGEKAFYDCTGLTSIIIPESVTSIGSEAFKNCTNLTSITIPFIGTSASLTTGLLNQIFVVKSLINVTITSARYIPSKAFTGCSNLTTIVLPDSLDSIGYAALYGCGSLQKLVVPFVGSRPNASLGDKNSRYYGIYGESKDLLGYIFGTDSYTGGVATLQTSVSSYSQKFYIPSSLHEVVVTNAAAIPLHAFENCTNINSIVLSDNTTSILPYAFYKCTGLKSLTIPESVESISDNAFYGCTGFTTPVYNSHFFVRLPINYKGSYIVPEGITSVLGQVFDSCDSLTSVILPNSARHIGPTIFKGCSSLQQITIPFVGDSIKTLNSLHYFFEKSSYSSTPSGYTETYSNVKTAEISKGYYLVPSSLNEVVLTKATQIQPSALYGFYVQSITLPNTVTVIDTCAFAWTGLTHITIPESVKVIGPKSFYYCKRLASVTFPNSISMINDEAFVRCDSLLSVVITHLDTLGNEAFISPYFSDLYIESPIPPVPTIKSTSWDPCPSKCKVHVPCGASAAYSEAWGNTGFNSTILEPASIYNISCSNTEEGVVEIISPLTCSNDVAQLQATPNAYYEFVSWDDGTIENPRTVTVTSDTTFSAIFAAIKYIVTAQSADSTMGIVTGSGEYAHGEVTIEAIPNKGYYFVSWTDGNTDNPRKIDIVRNATYTAEFADVEIQDIAVTTTDNSATFTWSAVEDAETYVIEIMVNSEVVVTITLDANGQVTNVDVKSTKGTTTDALSAVVSDLNANVSYSYRIEAKDVAGVVLASKEGSFKTKKSTALEVVAIDGLRVENGRIIYDGDFRIYDMLGRDVTRLNGNLQGVYVVKIGDKTQKVVVK